MMFGFMLELLQQFQLIGEQVEQEFLTGRINPFADSCRSNVNAFKDFLTVGLKVRQIQIDISRWEMRWLFQ